MSSKNQNIHQITEFLLICSFDYSRKLKERLRITPRMSMGYQAHKDTMVKAGSQTKNTYTL